MIKRSSGEPSNLTPAPGSPQQKTWDQLVEGSAGFWNCPLAE